MKRAAYRGLWSAVFLFSMACGGSNTSAPDQGSDVAVLDMGADLPTVLDIPDVVVADTPLVPDLPGPDTGSDTVEVPQEDTTPDITINDPGASTDQSLPSEDSGSDLPTALDVADTQNTQDPGSVPDVLPVQDEPALSDLLDDPGTPLTDEGGEAGGPFLGYVQDGYYIIDYTFHEVEMESGTNAIKIQKIEIVLPPEFLSVDAQISIRGDLDSFPMAFMTFIVDNGEATTQCGSMTGMPQLPNNILDDQLRVAFPRPENLDPASIFAPATPPYDYKPVECPERFEGKEVLEIGMAGAFIYPPGEAGNQGPGACGGWGCPNDARVILRFELPQDGPAFDASSPPDMSDTGTEPATDMGTPDWGWQETALGTCDDPAEFALSADHPLAQVTHLGSTLHVVPWPPFTAACPQNKPPFALEFFYKVTLSDYGLVNFSVSHDTAPWAFEQTWLDILSGCGEALQCGQSYQDLQGIVEPGEYIINLTEAPPGEEFPADQTDWSFTLTAELTPLSWSEEATVTSSSTTQVARNNASMSVQDSDGLVHAVWVQGGEITHGWPEALDGSWAQAPLPMANSIEGFAPTIVSLDGVVLLAAWTETLPTTGHGVVLVWSEDKGQTWSEPVMMSSAEQSARSPSLYAGLSEEGSPSATIAWSDQNSQKVWSRAWTGGVWSDDGWTAAVPLEQGDGNSKDVALGGDGPDVYAVWEDTRNGSAQIFLTRSTDGGITWATESALGVSAGAALDSAGERPSVGVGPDGQTYVTYEHNQQTFFVRSQDSGLSFEALYAMGPGNYTRLSSHSNGIGAVAWEFTNATPPAPDAMTVGLLLTFTGFEKAFGPFILPGSPLQTHRVMSSVSVGEEAVDIFWIDLSTGERQLTHQRLSF